MTRPRRAAVETLAYLAACLLASALLLRAIPWLLSEMHVPQKWQSVFSPLRGAPVMPSWVCLPVGLLFGELSARLRGRGRLWVLIPVGTLGLLAILLSVHVNGVPLLYPALTLLRLFEGGLLDAL